MYYIRGNQAFYIYRKINKKLRCAIKYIIYDLINNIEKYDFQNT